MLDCALLNVKPEPGLADAAPNRPPGAAAGVEDEAGPEVPGVPAPPKLNDMIIDVI